MLDSLSKRGAGLQNKVEGVFALSNACKKALLRLEQVMRRAGDIVELWKRLDGIAVHETRLPVTWLSFDGSALTRDEIGLGALMVAR